MEKRNDQVERKMELTEHKSRRKFGQHFTSREIFIEYILPQIRDQLNDYIFVDLFCGAGNLILPILNQIPTGERVKFFQENIFLFDVQQRCVDETIENAESYGIPFEIASKNIILQDTLQNYPEFLLKKTKPIFHITNPPYLYLGYIVKTEETQKYLPLFQGDNEGYQDLYQIALINDLRHNIEKMIYIIPSNFIFGSSVSNKIRNDFFEKYMIRYSYIFETKIFEYTGQNVMINTFLRKPVAKTEPVKFLGMKIGGEDSQYEKEYILLPENNYKAGGEFEEFIEEYQQNPALEHEFYLKSEEVEKNKGTVDVEVIDSSEYKGNAYTKKTIQVSEDFAKRIRNNTLWIRTVDTGTWEGRAGLYNIRNSFEVDGILVSKNTYRTNPIQIFFKKPISIEDQTLLRDYFNMVLESLRKVSDSEFMTTYKYSNGPYTRKYFGLSQTKKIIHTFPQLTQEEKTVMSRIIQQKDFEKLKGFLNTVSSTNHTKAPNCTQEAKQNAKITESGNQTLYKWLSDEGSDKKHD